MTTTTPTTFDVAGLVTALESRDADAQLAAYRPDAQLTIVDRDNPPSMPRTITGTDAALKLRVGEEVSHARGAGQLVLLPAVVELEQAVRHDVR